MRRDERASTLLTSNRPVDDWGKLLGDTAGGHRAPRSLAAPRPRAQVRASELAHEDPHRLAHRGRDEVELTCLGQPAEIAGFQLSTEEGKTVGVDATTLEANAAMRSIKRRDTGGIVRGGRAAVSGGIGDGH